jgi:hypothetical protein
MTEFSYNLLYENFYLNDLDFYPSRQRGEIYGESSIPSLFSSNSVLNDEISLSSNQSLSYNDLLNNSDNYSYNSSSFIIFQNNNSISIENKPINKEKKKPKKKEDNNINNNDNNNLNKIANNNLNINIGNINSNSNKINYNINNYNSINNNNFDNEINNGEEVDVPKDICDNLAIYYDEQKMINESIDEKEIKDNNFENYYLINKQWINNYKKYYNFEDII